MTNENNNNNEVTLAESLRLPPYVMFLFLSVGTGLGSTWGLNKFEDPRPDPFTGSDSVVLERRLQKQIDEHHLVISKLNDRIQECRISVATIRQQMQHDFFKEAP